MATEELFRSEPYTRACTATILDVSHEAIILDRTVFYPEGGGQPGDTGYLEPATGLRDIRIIDTVRNDDGTIRHVPEPFIALPEPGTRVNAVLDWDRRLHLMRMHTCLHLICALVPGARVTGGAVGAEKGRIDFDLSDAPVPTRDALQVGLERLVKENLRVTSRWITDEELAAEPDLVRTVGAQPPSGEGKVRLIEIEGVDRQPCGGTHVARTGEIGKVLIGKIENKGLRNRRIYLQFGA